MFPTKTSHSYFNLVHLGHLQNSRKGPNNLKEGNLKMSLSIAEKKATLISQNQLKPKTSQPAISNLKTLHSKNEGRVF